MTRQGIARGLAVVLVVVSIAGFAHVAWYAAGPLANASRLTAQARWLNSEIANAGAAQRMQQLFPEGAAFTVALTALASARAAEASTGAERDEFIGDVAARVDELASPEITSAYPRTPTLDHGVFLAGWTLQARVALARLTKTSADIDAVRTGARTLLNAFAATSQPFLGAYPGQVWPVDTVVAMAAVAEADQAFGVPGADVALRRWRERARERAVNELLPHQVSLIGDVLDGPRGSSSALTLAFLPSIDRQWSAAAWREFHATFVTRVVGAVGAREFPSGVRRSGDVDSGPLVVGVSLSASAVTVGAARANGDPTLADDLLRQAEVSGFPLQFGGERRYALGQLPVGDAFLAWARSVPTAQGAADGIPTSPRPLWWVWLAPWLITAVVVVLAHRRLGSRSA